MVPRPGGATECGGRSLSSAGRSERLRGRLLRRTGLSLGPVPLGIQSGHLVGPRVPFRGEPLNVGFKGAVSLRKLVDFSFRPARLDKRVTLRCKRLLAVVTRVVDCLPVLFGLLTQLSGTCLKPFDLLGHLAVSGLADADSSFQLAHTGPELVELGEEGARGSGTGPRRRPSRSGLAEQETEEARRQVTSELAAAKDAWAQAQKATQTAQDKARDAETAQRAANEAKAQAEAEHERIVGRGRRRSATAATA
ncbi:cell envelope integrity protein TolA [Streptomyces aureus]|uniref:cell envelope integrity protein TolA n=1 Tax=Streptomyces aureus TaxID=193461 RepID=UPI00368E3897